MNPKDAYINHLLAITQKFEEDTGVEVLDIHFKRIFDMEPGQVSESSLIREIKLELK